MGQSIHGVILAGRESIIITIVFRTYDILSHRNQDSTQIFSHFGVQFGTTTDLLNAACFGKVGPPKNLVGQILVQGQIKKNNMVAGFNSRLHMNAPPGIHELTSSGHWPAGLLQRDLDRVQNTCQTEDGRTHPKSKNPTH